MEIEELLSPYNPWRKDPAARPTGLPSFHRPIFHVLLEDLDRFSQILSITGPRRIGKSTLLHQLIQALLDRGVPARRIVYYSLDDPALERAGAEGGDLLQALMKGFAQDKAAGPAYLFLDEVQRFGKWELHLKKYFDLKYPVRIVISGSASSPIFKKSRESLLGRVKDYHLLPFSFRETLLYDLRKDPASSGEVERLRERGKRIQAFLTGDPSLEPGAMPVTLPSDRLKPAIDAALRRHFLEGGFPEAWQQPDWVAKQEYLFDNQVKKVICEDLLLAAPFRKPEALKRFYVSLLERPGREVSLQGVSEETGTNAQQIEKYLPLLEMTDLVYRIEKFRKSVLRVRKGRMKFYLVDLALRNAVLRLTETLLADDETLGLYAENLVFLALRKWSGTIQMDYYRERDGEVDFVVHVGQRTYLPVEVKYRNRIGQEDLVGLRRFASKHRCGQPLVVSRRWEDFGAREGAFFLPLPLFLLMFD